MWDIIQEMEKRRIKYQRELFLEIFNFCQPSITEVYPFNISYPEHNDRYLRQCYYNLQEKADRGIITEDEWLKITDRINIDYLNICK